MIPDPAKVRAIVVELQVPSMLRAVLAELRAMGARDLEDVAPQPQPLSCALVERVVPVVCRVWRVERGDVLGERKRERIVSDGDRSEDEVLAERMDRRHRKAAQDAAVELLCRLGLQLGEVARIVGIHRNWASELREHVARWESEDQENHERLQRAAEEIGC